MADFLDLDSDDFTSYADGASWLPRAGWTASAHNAVDASGWKIYAPTDVLYSTSGDQWVWYDTGQVNHRSVANVKTSLALNAIGGVVVAVDTTLPYRHIGFEIVYTSTEDKLILYYKTGSQAGSNETILWEDTAFGFTDETFYELDLEIRGNRVTAKIDGVTKYSNSLTTAQRNELASWNPHGAGLVTYQGSPNYDDVVVSAQPPMTSLWQENAYADPATSGVADDFEIGTLFVVQRPISIEGVRIFSPGGVARADRRAKLWTKSNTTIPINSAPLPDTMPAGWTEYLFTGGPTAVSPGTVYIVSYDVGPGDDYRYTPGLTAPLSDGVVDYGDGTDGIGRYNVTPDVFPSTLANQVFYGIEPIRLPSVATNIYLGDTMLDAAYLGDAGVQKVFLGATQVY